MTKKSKDGLGLKEIDNEVTSVLKKYRGKYYYPQGLDINKLVPDLDLFRGEKRKNEEELYLIRKKEKRSSNRKVIAVKKRNKSYNKHEKSKKIIGNNDFNENESSVDEKTKFHETHAWYVCMYVCMYVSIYLSIYIYIYIGK